MKITKKHLDQIINEEIEMMIESGEIDEGIFGTTLTRGIAGLGKMKDVAAGKMKGMAAGFSGDEEKFAAARAQQTQAGEKAEQVKVARTVNSHMKALADDLKALGVPITGQLKASFTNMRKLVAAQGLTKQGKAAAAEIEGEKKAEAEAKAEKQAARKARRRG